MQRRQMFKAALGSMAAATLAGTMAGGAPAGATPRPAPRPGPQGRPRLHIVDIGQGPVLLFLAGWGLSSAFWQYHAADLVPRGYRCVAYDRRGHGRSEDPGSGYDFDTLADDLAAVMAARDLGDITLVAHSMAGGEVARYLTRHGSGRVARVVLVGTTTPWLQQAPDNPGGVPAAMFEQLRAVMTRDFPKWVMDNNEAFWLGQVSPEMQAWGRSLLLQPALPTLLACNRAMTATDFRPDLAAIRVPVLVVHGRKDASAPLPLTGAPTAQQVKGSTLIVYDDAAHGLPLTHRQRLTGDILGFMG